MNPFEPGAALVRRFPLRLLLFVLLLTRAAVGQSPNGTISGLVLDPSGGSIPGAEILIVNDATGIRYPGATNGEGIYAVPNLPPGPYRIQISKIGFKTIIKPDVVLNVQSAVAINFTLPVGAVAETLTVEGGAPLVNTESASVSTVVDRQFAENLPLNGRSFQTLIQLTPGVVLAPSTDTDGGQFSTNGQRAASNYWMVDGVSANIGTSAFFQGNGLGGALGSYSASGGTNSLVSVDALQEFRIQTSTYAPEFGRTPGAQISILTRSGTNQFHGTAFDYFRNDALDANDWFANGAGLPKPREKQNDFGGTFSGPILKDRTFFFFSYEGLRLRLPQVALTDVPSVSARQNALPELRPYLNAFPLPNGPASGTDQAAFNASFSDKSTMDAYSIRIDHNLRGKVNLFGRYNYSPSEIIGRGNGKALSELDPARITTRTGTLGATWMISPTTTDDLRFNYSRVNASSSSELDNFGGAVPLSSLGLPNQFTNQNANLFIDIFSLADGSYQVGKRIQNLQRQFNVVDSLSIQRGSHSIKAGIDFRRLSPIFSPFLYGQEAFFSDVPSTEAGSLTFGILFSGADATLAFRNFGAFAQDTWHILPRLTLTYGLRWDVDFAPSTTLPAGFPAVTGFNLDDLSHLALAPSGAPLFRTPYGCVAPRLGVTYQLSQSQNWGSVLRGGVGIFYDLADGEVGNLIGQFSYPFGALGIVFSPTFPLDPASAAPPPITRPGSGAGTVLAFDPNITLPYTLEWNAAIEHGVGQGQALSVSYVGAAGRRLIQTADVLAPNPNYAEAILVGNSATSDYHALQIQFQKRLSRGLQALAHYTWSHSIDTASAGSFGNMANTGVPRVDPNTNRGPSDFDIRNAFSAALTYDIPAPRMNAFTNVLLRSWSLESVIQARSAPPVNISTDSQILFSGRTQIRPDIVPNQPFYLFGTQYPGGKALNPGAFVPPPTDPNTNNPLRQGNLARNTLRGFGATQWDFAVHRQFPIHESFKIQFRVEMFNVLNHPNFGPPFRVLGQPRFGQATQMLAQSFNGGTSGLGGGAFNPLYQIGGPRSIQFALKFLF
jgi:hypothetical protein